MASFSRQSGTDQYDGSRDPSRAAWPICTDARSALQQVRPPSYQGLNAELHQALGTAPGRYIMKARLFILALAVAPLAAMIGSVRSGR